MIGTNGYLKDNTSVFYESKKIKNADPDSFKLLELNETNKNAYFSKDNKRVYFKGEEIESANPNQFNVIEGNYSKDNKSVFFKNKLIKDANPKSFRFIKPLSGTNCEIEHDEFYATDEKFIYYGSMKIRDADLKTFETEYTCYKAHDKNYNYEKEKIISRVEE